MTAEKINWREQKVALLSCIKSVHCGIVPVVARVY